MHRSNNPISIARDILGNKQASSYIKWVCVILFIIIIIAFLISFITAIDTVEGIRSQMKYGLDGYVDAHSIEIYQAVKQNDSDFKDNETLRYDLNEAIYGQIGMRYDAGADKYVKCDKDGNPLYYLTPYHVDKHGSITGMSCGTTGGNNKAIYVTITRTATVPVSFMGVTTVWVDVPITITSEFTPKFD